MAVASSEMPGDIPGMGNQNRIRELRLLRGLTMDELSQRVETTQSQIFRLENGQRRLTDEWMRRLGAALGVQPWELLSGAPHQISLHQVEVIGEVAAGLFRESLEWDPEDRFFVALPPDPRYPGIRTFGVRVRGTSMNELYPEGSILNCIQIYDLDRDPKNDERVIVRRRNHHDGWEFTCKELRIEKDGSHWIWPRSHDPNYQTPWKLEASDSDDSAGVPDLSIVALVIGSYKPE